MRLILFSLFFCSILSNSIAQTRNNEELVDGKVNVKVKDPQTINVQWGNINKDMHYVRCFFDTSVLKRDNLIYRMEKDQIHKLGNILLVNNSNLFVVVSGYNSSIVLLGFKKVKDSIFDYINNSDKLNYPIVFRSPSIVFDQYDDMYRFIGVSKNKYHEYGDTLFRVFVDVSVVTSVCCSSFTSFMYFPRFLINDEHSVYENDTSFYKKILFDELIENPLNIINLKNK